jgi:tetratricopeptide (TPR) repeat protein
LGAIALLHKALELDPEYIEALNNLGARYIVIGKYSEALPFLNKAIEIDPSAVQPYCNLSLAFLGSGDPVAAERAARQAIDNDGSDNRSRYLLGISLVAQRKLTKETTQSLRRVQDDFPQARIALGMAEAAAGRTAEAKATLTEYLKLNQPYKREVVQQLLARLEAQKEAAAQ